MVPFLSVCSQAGQEVLGIQVVGAPLRLPSAIFFLASFQKLAPCSDGHENSIQVGFDCCRIDSGDLATSWLVVGDRSRGSGGNPFLRDSRLRQQLLAVAGSNGGVYLGLGAGEQEEEPLAISDIIMPRD